MIDLDLPELDRLEREGFPFPDGPFIRISEDVSKQLRPLLKLVAQMGKALEDAADSAFQYAAQSACIDCGHSKCEERRRINREANTTLVTWKEAGG